MSVLGEAAQPDPNVLTIEPGQLAVRGAPTRLCANGVGSSVVVALWDSERALGGLAYLPLPERQAEAAPRERFVDSGIELLVDRLLAVGCSRSKLAARAAGGAALLVRRDGSQDAGPAHENVRVLRATLARLGIPLEVDRLGGRRARRVELDTRSGDMHVAASGGTREPELS